MDGEPQPGSDRLDKAIFAIRMIWFGLFSGGLVLTVLAVAIITSGGGAILDLGVFNYFFLVPVPLLLIGSYAIVPQIISTNPAEVIEYGQSRGRGAEGWGQTTPDDAYHWFPVYAARFFLRASLIEFGAFIVLIGFFMTGDWVILGGAILMLMVLATLFPTRAAAETLADELRSRQPPWEPEA